MCDPFTIVYNGIWSLLEASDEFTSMVKPGNRIKFTGDDRRDPLKREVSQADLPEVRLICTASTPHLMRTSNASTFKKTYEIQISSGSRMYDASCFPLEWIIFKALADWQATLLALTWCGKKFVISAVPGSIRNGIAESDLNRGITGWASIWAVDVEMVFATADLKGA